MTFALLTGLLCSTGCTPPPGQINGSPQVEMDNLRREIRFLKQQNSQLLRELADLRKQITNIDQNSRQIKADLLAEIDAATQQIEEVKSNLKDTNYRITSYRDRPKTKEASIFDPVNAADPDTLKTMTDPKTLVIDQSRTLYNTAYRDLSRGNYKLALQGFRQFVNDYANSDLTDNAQYWIGEVYYAQGRFESAIAEFEKVLTWYRSGDKTAAAMLKIGYSYLSLNENQQGKLYLEDLVKDFPNSDEASRAKGRLASLN